MLVSVIIPVFNGARFLGDALDSVVSQSYEPKEVIIVDDGSTDGSAGLARSREGVRVISMTHSGVAVARNQGLRASGGKLIAFLDADDLWTPDKLEEQVAFLDRHPETSGVFGKMMNFIQDGFDRPEWLKEDLVGVELSRYSIGHLLVRREVFDRVGYFDTSMPSGEDGDWLFRAQDAGIRFDSIDRLLLKRRIHDRNMSHDSSAVRAGILLAVRQSLARKKENP